MEVYEHSKQALEKLNAPQFQSDLALKHNKLYQSNSIVISHKQTKDKEVNEIVQENRDKQRAEVERVDTYLEKWKKQYQNAAEKESKAMSELKQRRERVAHNPQHPSRGSTQPTQSYQTSKQLAPYVHTPVLQCAPQQPQNILQAFTMKEFLPNARDTRHNNPGVYPSAPTNPSYSAVPPVKLYVLQEDFDTIASQLEAMLKQHIPNCIVEEWRMDQHVPGNSLLLHCVVVDTRFDHIALPQRVRTIQGRWGPNNYIFLRVHNQTGVHTYENDDVNRSLEGVCVWKSKYQVKVSMGGGQSYTKHFIDSDNIVGPLAKKIRAM